MSMDDYNLQLGFKWNLKVLKNLNNIFFLNKSLIFQKDQVSKLEKQNYISDQL